MQVRIPSLHLRFPSSFLLFLSLELRALMSFMACNVSDLCFPLMALIGLSRNLAINYKLFIIFLDYLGYRVIATSLLPVSIFFLFFFFLFFFESAWISQNTIVYGTSNAAITIHNGHAAPEFMQNIRKAAKLLNLVSCFFNFFDLLFKRGKEINAFAL
jgi:hypothetical protein